MSYTPRHGMQSNYKRNNVKKIIRETSSEYICTQCFLYFFYFEFYMQRFFILIISLCFIFYQVC